MEIPTDVALSADMPFRSHAAMIEHTSHSIAIVTTVTVIRIAVSGCPFDEGRATILDAATTPHFYWAQFIGDPTIRKRAVHPDSQRDPERVLAILADIWRAGIEADANFSDFFLEDI